MARHRFNISSKGAVLPGRNDVEMGPANSLHASAYYSKYNERFDLIFEESIWGVPGGHLQTMSKYMSVKYLLMFKQTGRQS